VDLKYTRMGCDRKHLPGLVKNARTLLVPFRETDVGDDALLVPYRKADFGEDWVSLQRIPTLPFGDFKS
jgi:hypothetical protein